MVVLIMVVVGWCVCVCVCVGGGPPYTVGVPGGYESQGLHGGALHACGESHGVGRHAGQEAYDGLDAGRMSGVAQGLQRQQHVLLAGPLQAVHRHVQQGLRTTMLSQGEHGEEHAYRFAELTKILQV